MSTNYFHLIAEYANIYTMLAQKPLQYFEILFENFLCGGGTVNCVTSST